MSPNESTPTTPGPAWGEIPAGRALDAIVAERVMGWRRRKNQHPFSGTPPGETNDATGATPLFSTDIAAAWDVIARLMESHFMVSVTVSHEMGWWCVVYPPSGSAVETEYAESAPLAICRAALAAREGE